MAPFVKLASAQCALSHVSWRKRFPVRFCWRVARRRLSRDDGSKGPDAGVSLLSRPLGEGVINRAVDVAASFLLALDLTMTGLLLVLQITSTSMISSSSSPEAVRTRRSMAAGSAQPLAMAARTFWRLKR